MSQSASTPQIVIAKEAGACFGVTRALNMVREAAASIADADRGEAICTLGPLIHNPQVVADLEDRGVRVVDEPSEASGQTVVLRTHGVTPEVEAAAREHCSEVIDATCPFVKRAHLAAERLAREGYQVVVVGETGHPEVEGTVGHAPDALVVETPADLVDATVARRVGVVVQTTMTHASLRAIVDELLERAEEVRVINTICDATSERQEAAAELARSADVMIVIGGRNSANTTHLAEICAGYCMRTHHIETPDELVSGWFDGAALVGITAGASTPAEQIVAVRARVEELAG